MIIEALVDFLFCPVHGLFPAVHLYLFVEIEMTKWYLIKVKQFVCRRSSL